VIRMRNKYKRMLLLVCGLTVPLAAQTPLAQAFAGLRSSDPATVKKANDGIAELVVQELPTIEKDSATICDALNDKDAYIRQQATGILQTIVLIAPQHNSVVQACFPGLIATAKDQVDRVRNNALFALAMNPASPPAQAHDVFVIALASANFRTAEIGAAGLIRETNNTQKNHELVEKALEEASDAKHRLNILYAISGSKVPSDTLFQASQRYLDDSDPGVQHAAIDAVVATGADKSKVISVMQNLEDSSSASVQQKKHAEAVLNSLKTPK
jgi:hypothetical protein